MSGKRSSTCASGGGAAVGGVLVRGARESCLGGNGTHLGLGTELLTTTKRAVARSWDPHPRRWSHSQAF